MFDADNKQKPFEMFEIELPKVEEEKDKSENEGISNFWHAFINL